ncbi:MAG: sulfatase-like hydrolase/transferase [Bacteroidetes bacterium]|jgi:hypothetical protein|nr:sulfatase-like hydrolase/transferase [Bacteroidota bacterium]
MKIKIISHKCDSTTTFLIALVIIQLFVSVQMHAQTNSNAKANTNAPNLIIITTDGFRWQEVFNGMNFDIANQSKFNHGDSSYIYKKYGANTISERQKLLMPFFWNTVTSQGQLYGNRNKENKVDVANPYWFSYPGYNEIFTGYPDTAINSNEYPPNPHSNVLAFLNKQKPYQGKVVAFGAWDAYDRILNESVSGFPVINGFESFSSILKDATTDLLSSLLKDSYKPFKEVECLDVFTHYQAMHYLKTKQPKAMYISYGETDEWAHHGNYSNYLDAVHQVDEWIGDIWNWAQTTPGYKDNTYILVTTDHGRGFGNDWTDHGADVKGASSIWFALLGPDVKKIGPLGEQTKDQQLFQKQLAATISKLIGYPFTAEHPVGPSIY